MDSGRRGHHVAPHPLSGVPMVIAVYMLRVRNLLSITCMYLSNYKIMVHFHERVQRGTSNVFVILQIYANLLLQ